MKMKAKPKLKHKFKLEPGFKQFLWKTAIFIAAFMVFLLSVMSLVGFYIIELYSLSIPLKLINIILVHILGISIFLFLAVGIYGISFVKHFLTKFKKELLYFIIFGIIVYALMNVVWSLWPYLSLGVLEATK